MQRKRLAFSCGAALLLVLASASYAADMPSDVTAGGPPDAMVAPADTVTPPQNAVDMARDSVAVPSENTNSPAG